MVSSIRRYGIIPFFRGKIAGWSIEDLTDPGCWFTSSDNLGPWDWKIDAVREGDIAYGKFICNKAAFASVEWYRHLMNWRRSLPQYRIPVGGRYEGNNMMDRLYKTLSPVLLDAIREFESIEPSDMRDILQKRVKPAELKKIGGSLEKYLVPKIKRTAVDFLNLYLEMGTWTVIGDFRRIYRGANMEYTGWQRSSITTPDLLFKTPSVTCGNEPFWAKMFVDDTEGKASDLSVDCSPEESLDLLVNHIEDVSGCHDRDAIRKVIG